MLLGNRLLDCKRGFILVAILSVDQIVPLSAIDDVRFPFVPDNENSFWERSGSKTQIMETIRFVTECLFLESINQ